MSPKVASILNNAKTFLSDDEMRELAQCIEKDFPRDPAQPKKTKKKQNDVWTIEECMESLLATHFRKKPALKAVNA